RYHQSVCSFDRDPHQKNQRAQTFPCNAWRVGSIQPEADDAVKTISFGVVLRWAPIGTSHRERGRPVRNEREARTSLNSQRGRTRSERGRPRSQHWAASVSAAVKAEVQTEIPGCRIRRLER